MPISKIVVPQQNTQPGYPQPRTAVIHLFLYETMTAQLRGLLRPHEAATQHLLSRLGLLQLFVLFQRVQKADSQQDYDKVIQQYAELFAQHWRKAQGQPIKYGPATKMINLLVKAMYFHGALCLGSLPKWYNLPFDSYTLRPLLDIIDDLLPDLPYKIPMNRQMIMNYVVCKEHYQMLQMAIRHLCRGTGKTPLDYEVWAWDSRH